MGIKGLLQGAFDGCCPLQLTFSGSTCKIKDYDVSKSAGFACFYLH